jgi:SPP1 gp7 family putative phage head morphogenesis protein
MSGDTRQKWTDIVERSNNAGLTARANAETVARTEVARAHTTLQAVRAKHMGSELFEWRTAGDATVRDLHDQISKRNVGYGRGIYRWDEPPELDDGRPGLPGTIWNCRCYARPVLPAVGEEGPV